MNNNVEARRSLNNSDEGNKEADCQHFAVHRDKESKRLHKHIVDCIY